MRNHKKRDTKKDKRRMEVETQNSVTRAPSIDERDWKQCFDHYDAHDG